VVSASLLCHWLGPEVFALQYIPYCGGDVHVGQRRAANSWGLYFAGVSACVCGAAARSRSPLSRVCCSLCGCAQHLTVNAVVQQLLQGTLGSATDVLVSGSSAGAGFPSFSLALRSFVVAPLTVLRAGGIGSFSNADFIADFLPQASVCLSVL
jgi:hypothetical protein